MPERVPSLGDASELTLDCRTEGHGWSFVTDTVTERRGRLLEFTQVRSCWRCGAKRSRTIDGSTFEIVRTVYTYGDGYLFAKGVRPTSTDVRREAVTRTLARRREQHG